MAPGRRNLRSIQFGQEANAGTAVDPTTYWRGPGDMLDDQREVVFVDEVVGIIGGVDRTYISRFMGQITLADTEATYEQLPYPLASAFGGPTTGVQDGTAGDAYIYQTVIPVNAENTPAPTPGGAGGTAQTFTVTAGDDFEVEQMEYALTTEITLSANGGEAVMMSSTMMGRQVQFDGTVFPGAATLPAVEEIISGLGTVFLNSVGVAYDSTLGTVSNQILGYNINMTISWIPKFTVDQGQKTFAFAVYTGHEITGDLTFEHDSQVSGTGSGEKVNWRNEVPRRLRVEVNSDNPFGTAGATYSAPAFIAQFPIKWTQFPPLDEQDGNDIVTGSFTSRYNTTVGDAGTIIVVNSSTALP